MDIREVELFQPTRFHLHEGTESLDDMDSYDPLTILLQLCWLLGTSVRKADGFAFDFFIFLAALVLHR